MNLIIIDNNKNYSFDLNQKNNDISFFNISNIAVQNDNNIVIITSLSDDSSIIFNKIIDLIHNYKIEKLSDLKTYLDDILADVEFEDTILNELKLLIDKNKFSYEIIDFDDTASGEDGFSSIINTVLVESIQSNKKYLLEKSSIIEEKIVKNDADVNNSSVFPVDEESKVIQNISFVHLTKDKDIEKTINNENILKKRVVKDENNTSVQDNIIYISKTTSSSDVEINDGENSVSASPSTISSDDETVLSITAFSATEDTSPVGTVVATFTVSDNDESVNIDFTSGSNTNGYYEISGSNILLTSAGKIFLDNEGILPQISLSTSGTSTNKTVTASPSTISSDDETVLSITALSASEDTSPVGTVVATFTVSDSDESVSVDFTSGSNTNAYYEISGSNILLTSAGKIFLDNEGILPQISLSTSGTSTNKTVTASPSTISSDDETVLSITALSASEDTSPVGTVVATFTVSDNDETAVVDFTSGSNTNAYYEISGTNILLTSAGKIFLDNEGILPEISLSTSGTSTNKTVTATPSTISNDDETVLSLTALSATEDVTLSGAIVATFTLSDNDETAVVDFTSGSNTNAYYEISGTNILLTSAGKIFLDNEGILPEISLSTSGTSTNKTVTATPSTIRSDDETVLSADTASTNEDTAVTIDVLANDTDIDGSVATLISVTNGTNGTTSIVSGKIVYAPNADFSGNDSFIYTNSEGNTASVSVTVNALAVTPITSLDNSGFTGSSGVDIIDVTSQLKGVISLLGGDDIIETDSHLHVNATLDTGDGDDEVTIGGITHGTINTGANDDSVTVKGQIKNSIDGGSGTDTILLEYYSVSTYTAEIASYLTNFESIILNDGTEAVNITFSVDAYDTIFDTTTSYSDIDSGSTINSGNLNDNITISGNIKSKLLTSNGNDKVIVSGNVEATLNTGENNDFVYVDGSLTEQGKILAGDGDDYVFIKGNSEGEVDLGIGDDYLKISGSTIKEVINAGMGTDSIYLEDILKEDYDDNKDNIQSLLISFENIKFKDGEIIGDTSVFSEYFFASESTPLILDLEGDGIETLSLEDGVRFDINNDGLIDQTSWVGASDALLVRDINGDGLINDASELFGEETIKSDGRRALDGFDALSDLDSNLDGVINSEDEAFDDLLVWKDSNSDGITQATELLTLEDIDLSEISLNANAVSIDTNGSTIGLEGSYTTSSGEENEISDVWFRYISSSENDNESISLNIVDTSVKENTSIDISNLNLDEYIDMNDSFVSLDNENIVMSILEEDTNTLSEIKNENNSLSYDYYYSNNESYITTIQENEQIVDTF